MKKNNLVLFLFLFSLAMFGQTNQEKVKIDAYYVLIDNGKSDAKIIGDFPLNYMLFKLAKYDPTGNEYIVVRTFGNYNLKPGKKYTLNLLKVYTFEENITLPDSLHITPVKVNTD
jgi:hypothetical protein